MGTSLSGLTPATTFDGLLKTSDNEPLDGTLKAISTGDGTDTMLELSTSALQIGGATGMYWDNTNKRLGINNTSPAAPLEVNGEIRSTSLIRLMIGGSNKVLMQNANTVINSDVAIGQAAAPSARLHIKGSGATSATTSLLVQNSAGANVIKANDDGRVLLGAGTTYQNHLLELNGEGLGSTQTLLRLQSSVNFNGAYTGIGFTNSTNGSSLSSEIRAYRESYGNALTFNFAGTEMLRATSEGNLGIGETTPTARLHIKGSGNDNTTTSLLVQNSDGTDMVSVLDNGNVGIGTNAALYPLQNEGITKTQGLALSSVTHTNVDANEIVSRGAFKLSLKNSGGIYEKGINITAGGVSVTSDNTNAASSTQFHIKGSGATSATTALLVQNSAGTELFKVLDDGQLDIKSNSGGVATTSGTRLFSYSSGGGGVLDVNPSNGNSVKFRARGDNDTFLIETNPANDAVGIGLTGATAKLQVKGSGNDATTTALLVQNSDGDNMLKVNDQGHISASGDRLTIGDGKDVTLRILASGNSLAGNNYIQPLGTPANQRFVVTGNSVATIKAVDLDASNVYIGYGINQTAATGTLSIKGTGATSATTALLVENSAGTELLKVEDDGTARFSGQIRTLAGQSIYNGRLVLINGRIYNLNPNVGELEMSSYNLAFGDTGDTTPDASAAFQVNSTERGFLPPRMTTTERDAISTPAAGLMVYNTTTNKAQCYNGTAWQDLF